MLGPGWAARLDIYREEQDALVRSILPAMMAGEEGTDGDDEPIKNKLSSDKLRNLESSEDVEVFPLAELSAFERGPWPPDF